jgi:hypothetical protein
VTRKVGASFVRFFAKAVLDIQQQPTTLRYVITVTFNSNLMSGLKYLISVFLISANSINQFRQISKAKGI